MKQAHVVERSASVKHTAFAAFTALALAGTLGLAACAAPADQTDQAVSGNNSAMGSASTGGDAAGGSGSMGDNASPDDGAYRKIDANEAQAMMDAGNVTVIDVRTPQEYADAHIPGAINIPLESIGSEKPAELTDTDADLIVYCRSGVRSKQASDKLVALGYQHVNDMGGIIDWHGNTVPGDEPGGN